MADNYRLGVLPGDGIGPEIVPAAVQVLDAAVAAAGGAPIEWVPLPLGADAIETHGSALPPVTLETLERARRLAARPARQCVVPGASTGRSSTRAASSASTSTCSPTSGRRRPSRGRPRWCPALDLVVVRENTEGFYADRSTYRGTGEYMPTPDVAIAMGIFTRPAIERIARQAFELADAAQQASDHRPQGERAAADHGLLPRHLPRDRRRVPGRQGRRLPHRRDDRAPGPARRRLRRPRHREHVRRHPVRPGRRAGRVARHRAVASTPPATTRWPRPRTARHRISPVATWPTRSR